MLSTKPYLVRAFYDWIIDNHCTPFIVINAEFPRCNVPAEYVEDGEIVFNISPDAIRDLKIRNNVVEFRASFSGVVRIISAPIRAVLAIYAEENGQGMFFDAESEADGDNGDAEGGGLIEEGISVEDRFKKKKHPSYLRLVE